MLKYKTFWRRLVAGIIDGLVFLPLTMVGMWVTYNAASIPLSAFAAWHAASSFIYFAYSIILHGKYGQTLGKMAMKVRVMDVSEARPITYRQAVLRDIFPLVATLALLPRDVIQILNGTSYMLNPGTMPDGISMALGFVMMGWGLLEVVTMLMNSKRRAVHDFIAGSVVVRTDADLAEIPGQDPSLPTEKKTGSTFATGCIIAVVAFLTIVGITGYFAYTKVKRAMNDAGLEKPLILDRPGIAIGNGVLDRSVLISDARLGTITDLKWGAFIEGRETVLAAVSSQGAVFYSEDGSPIRDAKFTGHLGDMRIATTGSDHRYVFVNQGSWSRDASLIGPDGMQVWEYGGRSGVNCMSAGDMDGDGMLEFAVGFNGGGGIHLLNSNGDKMWEQPGGNIWHTEIVDVSGDGLMRIIHSDAGGRMAVRDRDGNIISQSKTGPYFSHFSICRWPHAESRPYCLLAENDTIWVFDFDATVAAQYDAPDCGTLGHAFGTPFVLSPDEKEAFAVIVNYSNWRSAILYVYNSSRSLIYQEVIGESCSAITTLRNSDGNDTILVGGYGKIYAYSPAAP